ncbi:DUF2345 domain-containing protein, partial [Psychrobacter sp.]|uniref:DUF2345 domain-containing protein n=1 Tax=Psychrobacter sp. TaxID=56811 RepID=UPI003C732EC4
GLHISANREPIGIQAQGGELQLHSKRGMTIGSESGQVNVSSPKRIKLQTSAGASITIDDSGIKLVCPGTIKIKAVKKELVAGAWCHYTPPEEPYNEMYVVKDTLGNIIAGFAYKIKTSEGKVYRGVTNDKGETIRIGTGNKSVEFELTADTNEEDK